ncbi:hypothetical protein ETAA8_46060 [Anatilimnocola aggregata]|uniref:DUF480 domain-containing protein n=1 Tax=Anatilimnocola aggregata TaxID=2528021 RepID=A0A517YGX7_9BACT|nr:DUF480 domain-containing protein [Anatilimnocola aggregata]QDU29495.1 hypothetical protein ETAA8_46060 [Anatilimnocola aggregata]
MSEQQAGGEEAKRLWQPLNSRQRRVFGVLVEKAKTTPDAYPMTLNGIVTGCNQKSNREPLMTLSAEEVEQILDELRGMSAVTEVQGSGRVAKYRHHAYEWLGVDKFEISVMTELLLRGEQTLGDLRARASRMEPIADQGSLKLIVDGLLKKKLMVELTPPGRGQIVSHNLYKEREIGELRTQYAGHVGDRGPDEDRPAAYSPPSAPAPVAPRTSAPAVPAPRGVTADEFAELRVEVAEMQAEISRLRSDLRQLEAKWS